MKYYVYGLVCPIEERVKYVGMSNEPEKRLLAHKSNPQGNNVKWIDELKKQSKSPSLYIIEEVDNIDKALERERHWIKFYAEKWPINNISHNMPKNYSHSYCQHPSHAIRLQRLQLKQAEKGTKQTISDIINQAVEALLKKEGV